MGGTLNSSNVTPTAPKFNDNNYQKATNIVTVRAIHKQLHSLIKNNNMKTISTGKPNY